MKLAVVLVIAAVFHPGVEAVAQEEIFGSNTWGFYISPTTHRLVSASSQYEMFHTNTGEDIGLYYCRSIHPFLRLQIEGRYEVRQADIEFSESPARVNEEFLEVPLILHVSRVRRFGRSYFRLFVGGGISYRILIEQEVAFPPSGSVPPSVITPIDIGGYQKFGWVLDGGCSILLTRRGGIFASYRITKDQSTVSKSDDLVVNPKYYSYGIQVGFEFNFGN
jgi:hypothetical protein